MTYFEAVLYGAVQGISEYLPISSSAHLILLPKFLGTTEMGLTFDVFLHIGTLAATLIFFWKDWRAILRQVLNPRAAREPGSVDWRWIVIATVPALIAGAAFHSWISTALRGNVVIMSTLVFWGVTLFVADRFAPARLSADRIGLREALGIGLFQCLALIPGTSRSGVTMTAGRIFGLDRASAARFSFLISAPITGAAIVFELRHWRELVDGMSASAGGVGPLVVAGFSSFAFGVITISGLLHVVKRFGYASFAIYRVALAGVIYFVLGL